MLERGARVGRYVIEERLGAGGMGEVYRARDPELARAVALKRLLPGDGPARSDWIARMLREARAAAAFSHANAVAIYDVGTHEELPFLVMELVKGRDLRAFVTEKSPDYRERVRWMIEAGQALAAAHAAGLVHRDIKPDNLMLADTGSVKVLDFGIARKVASDKTDPLGATEAPAPDTITREGASVGTPAYMAPEQLRAAAVDGRTDQFAWGVTLFELLTGQLPWGDANGLALVAAVLTQEPDSLLSKRPELPPALAKAIARTLSKDPTARFPTMNDAVAAVRGSLDDSALPAAESPAAAVSVTKDASDAATAATTAITADEVRAITGPGDLTASKTVAASDAATSPAAEPAPPPFRLSTVHVVLAVVALGVLGLIARGALGPRAETLPAASASGAMVTPQIASSAPSLAASFVPAGAGSNAADIRALPCLANVKNDCSHETRAWCDSDDHVVACCASPLVPVAKSGICGCPPGGYEDAGSDCPVPKNGDGDFGSSIGPTIATLKPALRQCYDTALAKNHSLAGTVLVALEVGPNGSVVRSRVKEGRLASADVQLCVLDALTALHFNAPPNGTWSITVPVSFVKADGGH